MSGAETPDALKALRATVPHVYEAEAEGWAARRARLAFLEQPWIDRAIGGLSAGARVLDIGAGAGEPISAYLTERGLDVLGIDIAPAMVRLAEAHVPTAQWRVGDMRHLDLAERFAAIIGWDSFFHLAPGDQRATLPRLVRHLAPGGRLLLTVGPRACEAVGTVHGRPVYHASLGAWEYTKIARGAGASHVSVSAEDPACDRRTLLLVEKAGARGAAQTD